MKIIISRYFVVTLLGIIISQNLIAQLKFMAYADIGETNISNGLYLKNGILGTYNFGKTTIEGGGQFDILTNVSSNVFSATSAKLSREFSIKDFPFSIQSLFIYDRFSDVIHETNLGILVNLERVHFTYKLGTDFRTFRITKKAKKKYSIDSNDTLNENWNLLYYLGYNLKPVENKWNVGATITNIDYFLINQETNPLIFISGRYRLSSPLELFVETWYKSAGTLNISANYFGFFIRTGVIWELN